MAEAVEHQLRRDTARHLLRPLLEGVVEIGSSSRAVQRRAGIPSIVVGGIGVGVAGVANVLRDLPARKMAEAAHISVTTIL